MQKYSARRRTGNIGEDIAVQYLVRKGYRIVERNVLRAWGELDIVAEKDSIVHFVEVKSATDAGFSREKDILPEELVHRSKLEKVARTASLYMEERRDAREYQIDVIGVIMDAESRTARCRLFEQVLDA